MDTKRLDLDLLVTLEALLVERNVTKAAARLHLSQPAVSAQLSRLRAMFDDALLIPVQRGMMPTAKAIELFDPLRQALDQARATVAIHRNCDPAKAKLIVAIACTDYLQVAVVKPFVKKLRAIAPGVQVALRNFDMSQLEAPMARGEVDLAFMTPQNTPSGLRARHLFDERYVLIGRRNHSAIARQDHGRRFCAVRSCDRIAPGWWFRHSSRRRSGCSRIQSQCGAILGFILIRPRDRVSVGLRCPGPGTASTRSYPQAQVD
jgi:DNA-binding transcriptional LysR family regulator